MYRMIEQFHEQQEKRTQRNQHEFAIRHMETRIATSNKQVPANERINIDIQLQFGKKVIVVLLDNSYEINIKPISKSTVYYKVKFTNQKIHTHYEEKIDTLENILNYIYLKKKQTNK